MKKLLILLTIFYINSFADTNVTKAINGCSLYSVIDLKKSFIWLGECKNGLASGKGEIIWYEKNSQIALYKGYMKKGKLNGRGLLEYPNGDVFDGTWRQNRKFGRGIFKKKYSDIIEAYWINNIQIPEEKAAYWIGDEIKGCIIHNPYPKKGETVEWNGKCKKGYAEGKGVVKWYIKGKKNGKFIGSLMKGKMQGVGKFEYSNGDVYEGDWNNSMRHGRGIYLFSSGDYYDGKWKNDSRVGKSKFEKIKEIQREKKYFKTEI